jgi:hypothetical protein
MGSDRGQTGVRPGSDRGQTGVRPLARRISQPLVTHPWSERPHVTKVNGDRV